MSPAEDPGGRRAFPTTHWSLVLSAGGQTDDGRTALADLCEAYWYPLYAYARRCGARPNEAEDQTQAFFAHLLEKDLLTAPDESRGRFRYFLRTAFRNYASTQYAARRAVKRGGGQRILSLDIARGERRYELEPADELTPDKVFDRQWALRAMERALDRVGERLDAAGSGEMFRAIRPILQGGTTTASYEDLATELGSTAQAVRAAVYRARKSYAQHLRAEIASTVAHADELDDEVADLMAAIRG